MPDTDRPTTTTPTSFVASDSHDEQGPIIRPAPRAPRPARRPSETQEVIAGGFARRWPAEAGGGGLRDGQPPGRTPASATGRDLGTHCSEKLGKSSHSGQGMDEPNGPPEVQRRSPGEQTPKRRRGQRRRRAFEPFLAGRLAESCAAIAEVRIRPTARYRPKAEETANSAGP
jgi:hypothetical protein